MTRSVRDLTRGFDITIRGNPDAPITSVGTLPSAGPDQIAFLANPAYRSSLKDTRAGAVILSAEDADQCPTTAVVTDQPYLVFARVAAQFAPGRRAERGVHETAVVDPNARVSAEAYVGPLCFVGPGASIAEGAELGPGCVVEEEAVIGPDTRLGARVVVSRGVRLGARVIVHPGAVIGADGFGIASDENGEWVKVPQLGSVVIGDDCEIGANTTIDRGAIEDTTLGDDVRIDNLVQVGHNVRIGSHTAIAGAAAIAGSATIGARCLIGGGVGVVGHITIADGVTVTARTLVTRSIAKPGVYSSGTPMEENARWRRNAARIRQLDKLARDVARLAKDQQA